MKACRVWASPWFAVLVVVAAAGTASCDGGPVSDVSGVGDTPPRAESSSDAPRRGEAGQEATLVCGAAADGMLESTIGFLDFADRPAQVIVKEDAAKGCVHEATVFIGDSDCTLEFTFISVQGAWEVRRGIATIGTGCGVDVASEYFGTWTLAADSGSTGGLDGTPESLPMGEDGCIDAAALQPTGVLHFELGEANMAVNLNELTLSGLAIATDAPIDSCPAIIEVCPAQSCGPDAYGKSCGMCGDGFACVDGECEYWNCPPEGPFGVEPGELLTDVALKDCDGNDYRLHDLCGADAAYINVLAGW